MTVSTTTPATPAVDVLAFLGLDPRDVKAQALVAICSRYGLDPLLGHVVLVDRKPYITRDGLLAVAHASGLLDGIELVGDPTLSADGSEWVARVRVYRRDWSHPTEYPGRYPARGRNAYGPEMAVKCAEAMALRRAFPVSGLAVLDEIHDAAPVDVVVDDAPLEDRSAPRRSSSTMDRTRDAMGLPRKGDTRPATPGQLRAIGARLGSLNVRDPEHRAEVVRIVLGLERRHASARDMSAAEASAVLDASADDLEAAAELAWSTLTTTDPDDDPHAPAGDDVEDAELVVEDALVDPDVDPDLLVDTLDADVVEELVDPDCRGGKHSSCVGGPCSCRCHADGPPARPRLSTDSSDGEASS